MTHVCGRLSSKTREAASAAQRAICVPRLTHLSCDTQRSDGATRARARGRLDFQCASLNALLALNALGDAVSSTRAQHQTASSCSLRRGARCDVRRGAREHATAWRASAVPSARTTGRFARRAGGTQRAGSQSKHAIQADMAPVGSGACFAARKPATRASARLSLLINSWPMQARVLRAPQTARRGQALQMTRVRMRTGRVGHGAHRSGMAIVGGPGARCEGDWCWRATQTDGKSEAGAVCGYGPRCGFYTARDRRTEARAAAKTRGLGRGPRPLQFGWSDAQRAPNHRTAPQSKPRGTSAPSESPAPARLVDRDALGGCVQRATTDLRVRRPYPLRQRALRALACPFRAASRACVASYERAPSAHMPVL